MPSASWEIVRNNKQLLGELKIKKDKMSVAQLQQYLVDKINGREQGQS